MLIDDYLAHLGLTERPKADLDGLNALHSAHLLSIPYENLDVQLGRPVTIERDAILDKILRKKRGGWCYEMNGTLGWALEELGFDVTRATGAVMRQAVGEAAVANHLVLRVELPEGSYIADTGFGDGPLTAFPIRSGTHAANSFTYRIEELGEDWWRLHNHGASNAPSFDFHTARGNEGKFAEQCAALQTSPQSIFVQNLIAFKHRKGAIDALLGRVLREMTAQGVTTRTLNSPEELLQALGDVFGLDVPEVANLWPRICARHDAVLAQPAKN